jgi:hypothetical protein
MKTKNHIDQYTGGEHFLEALLYERFLQNNVTA